MFKVLFSYVLLIRDYLILDKIFSANIDKEYIASFSHPVKSSTNSTLRLKKF